VEANCRAQLVAVSVISSLALGGTPGNLTDATVLPDWSSSRHQLETSRGKRKLRLVWRSGQSWVSVVSPRGSPGGAATFASLEAEAHAALDVGGVYLHPRRRHSADRLRAPVSVIVVDRAQDREYDDHHADGRRGGERHRAGGEG
jgi:hypothetical protein